MKLYIKSCQNKNLERHNRGKRRERKQKYMETPEEKTKKKKKEKKEVIIFTSLSGDPCCLGDLLLILGEDVS